MANRLVDTMSIPHSTNHDGDESCGGFSVATADARQVEREARMRKKEAVQFFKKQNRIVWGLRVLVFIILGALASGVCVNVYRQTRQAEIDNFESDFQFLGDKLLQSFTNTLSQRMGAVDLFARSIISQVNSDPTLNWPFVTIPDFEYRAGSTCKLADLVNLVLAVRVETAEKEAWEEYSVTNQGWRKEGLLVQGREETGNGSFVVEDDIENIAPVLQQPRPPGSPDASSRDASCRS